MRDGRVRGAPPLGSDRPSRSTPLWGTPYRRLRSIPQGHETSIPGNIRFRLVLRNEFASLVYEYEETTRCFRSSLVPQIQVMREHYPLTIKRAGVKCFCRGVLY